MANAMYCENGHYIEAATFHPRNTGELRAMAARAMSEGSRRPAAFCKRCGASTINACKYCQNPIELGFPGDDKPAYCSDCGKPYPWTETALQAAKQYADELEELSQEEKTTLKATFDDLTKDTASTPLAETRFKRMMKKIAPGSAAAITQIIVNVATEEVKKKLMGL